MSLPVSLSPDRQHHNPSFPEVRRVLIYRLGSLGDTVVALPCFHLIARAFPNAERRLLTNVPVNAKAPAAAAVLGPQSVASALVHGYMEYPVGTRNPLQLAQLALQIRGYRPEVLIYLAAPRGDAAVQRDKRFFRLCGLRTFYGLPLGELGVYQLDPATGLLESESSRLARSVRGIGDARLDDPASWDFHLTDGEKESALNSVSALDGAPCIVCAPGCKASANDWEDQNWSALFEKLSTRLAGEFALILTGAESERNRNERLRSFWRGPSLNVCGNSPREAAALLSRAELYVGPDSGPMHIAAAVGTRCVSIFSARLELGIWFPHGHRRSPSPHRIFYERTDCSPCGLETCTVEGKRCILSISPDQVLESIVSLLQPPIDSRGYVGKS